MKSWRLSGLVALATLIGFGQVEAADSLTRGLTSATGAGNSSAPAWSDNSRFLLFSSAARNLVPGGTGSRLDVYLYDRTNRLVELISTSATAPGGGKGHSTPGGISRDGRFAVFESGATNLSPLDTNDTTDIYLRDRQLGTTLLVSRNFNATQAANQPSQNPLISSDGHWVVYESRASDLAANDTNGVSDVFVYDVVLNRNRLVSFNSAGTAAGDGASGGAALSPDGSAVVFESSASNLVAGLQPRSGSKGEVYLSNLAAGPSVWVSQSASETVQGTNASLAIRAYNAATSTNGLFTTFKVAAGTSTNASVFRYSRADGHTDLIATNAPGGIYQQEDESGPLISADGRYVAYIAARKVWLWDATTGNSANVSATLSGDPAGSQAGALSLSLDGRAVGFVSTDTNITATAAQGTANFHAYAHHLDAGIFKALDLDRDGKLSPTFEPQGLVISPDGLSAAFSTPAPNLVADDRNSAADVFLRDLTTDQLQLVSARNAGLPGPVFNSLMILSEDCASADGRYVVFTSSSQNLVTNRTDGNLNVYLRDTVSGGLSLVSVANDGVSGGNGGSVSPVITPDGRFIAFVSAASNLLSSEDANGFTDVFVRDRQTGTTRLVSVPASGKGTPTGTSSLPSLSADGRYVLFDYRRSTASGTDTNSVFSGTVDPLYYDFAVLRDVLLQTNLLVSLDTNGLPLRSNLGVPIRSRIAADGGSVLATDGSFFTRTTLTPAGGVGEVRKFRGLLNTGGLVSLSRNGRFTSYLIQQSFGGPTYVGVVDWTTGTDARVFIPTPTNAYAFSLSAGAMAGPSISDDGRFVVYALNATTAGVSDINAAPDVYLLDRLTTNVTVVSRASGSLFTGNAASDYPQISADGRYIAFRSRATNLVPNDSNDAGDIFVYDRLSGGTTLVSARATGGDSADGYSSTPFFTPDGRKLIYLSSANNLTLAGNNYVQDLFYHPLTVATFEDTDHDGMDDAWERQNFGDLSHDGTKDSDGDGLTDYQEYLAGTNPNDPLSAFHATRVETSVQGPKITWAAIAGRHYGVQYKDDLAAATWSDLPGEITFAGTEASLIDTQISPNNRRYYRVIVTP